MTESKDKNTQVNVGGNQKEVKPSPQAMMMRMLGGTTFPLVIKCALKLGVLRVINEGITSDEEIAKHLDVNQEALHRLLRALVAMKLLDEPRPKNYVVTEFGATLLPGPTPQSIEPLALYLLDASMIIPMMNLSESVRTGKPSLEQDEELGWYGSYPERAMLMDNAMEVYSKISLPDLLAAYDFSQFNMIVDVAGGEGQLIAGILKTNPNVKGILFDIPETVKRASEYMKAEGLELRCETISGSMFDKIPSGEDLYILSKTLNNWNDKQALSILQNIEAAMSSNSKLIIVENIGTDNVLSIEEVFRDLIFLACSNGGKVRTELELRKLISEAGLELTRIISTSSLFPMMECKVKDNIQ